MTEEKKEKKSKKASSSSEDKIAKARKKRLALAEERKVKVEKTDEREAFRKYFLKMSKKIGAQKYLEDVIWAHLKAIKHDKEELFDKGIEHFGYKI